MAHSLKVVAGLLLTVLMAGCGTAPLTKTSTQRLNYVLTTQQRADEAYRAGDMAHATVLYQQLTEMIPQEADYWYMLGNTYVRTQQPDPAVQAYQQAIARNPNHTRAWHNLGIVRMRQATAAFVSSAGTATAEDPMHAKSTQLVDALARIGSGGTPQDQLPAASPLPITVSKPTASAGARRRPGTLSAGPNSP